MFKVSEFGSRTAIDLIDQLHGKYRSRDIAQLIDQEEINREKLTINTHYWIFKYLSLISISGLDLFDLALDDCIRSRTRRETIWSPIQRHRSVPSDTYNTISAG
jgi:hypothetical protein